MLDTGGSITGPGPEAPGTAAAGGGYRNRPSPLPQYRLVPLGVL